MEAETFRPVRVTDFDDLTTEQLLELATGRIHRMDGLDLALFTRLMDLDAELKALKARMEA